jgi:DNA-binding SARP family transcriptional activator
MRFLLLGLVEARRTDLPINVGGPREKKTLAALLLGMGHAVSVDRLVRMLWDDSPPATAVAQVHNSIAAVRRHLARVEDGCGQIARAGTGFAIQVEPAHLDVAEFGTLSGNARRYADAGDHAAAAVSMTAALALWRGPAFGGLGGDILTAEAHRLEEDRLTGLELRLECDLAVGRHHEVIGELSTLVAEHPTRERILALRMLALYRCGRAQAALDSYLVAHRLLAENLGLEPGPVVQRLQLAILRHDPALDRAGVDLCAGGHPVAANRSADQDGRARIPHPAVAASVGQAATAVDSGAPDVGLAGALDAAEAAHLRGYALLEGRALRTVAEAYLSRGENDMAATYADRALQIHRAHGHRLDQACATGTLRRSASPGPNDA